MVNPSVLLLSAVCGRADARNAPFTFVRPTTPRTNTVRQSTTRGPAFRTPFKTFAQKARRKTEQAGDDRCSIVSPLRAQWSAIADGAMLATDRRCVKRHRTEMISIWYEIALPRRAAVGWFFSCKSRKTVENTRRNLNHLPAGRDTSLNPACVHVCRPLIRTAIFCQNSGFIVFLKSYSVRERI